MAEQTYLRKGSIVAVQAGDVSSIIGSIHHIVFATGIFCSSEALRLLLNNSGPLKMEECNCQGLCHTQEHMN